MTVALRRINNGWACCGENNRPLGLFVRIKERCRWARILQLHFLCLCACVSQILHLLHDPHILKCPNQGVKIAVVMS